MSIKRGSSCCWRRIRKQHSCMRARSGICKRSLANGIHSCLCQNQPLRTQSRRPRDIWKQSNFSSAWWRSKNRSYWRRRAKQKHHTVVADMEQQLRSLEQERAELVDMVKLARQQGMEDRDEELSHGIELERPMLERMLDELDPDFRIDSQQRDGSLDAES